MTIKTERGKITSQSPFEFVLGIVGFAALTVGSSASVGIAVSLLSGSDALGGALMTAVLGLWFIYVAASARTTIDDEEML